MLSASIKVGNDEFSFLELPGEPLPDQAAGEATVVGPTRVLVQSAWDVVGKFTPGDTTLDDVHAPFNELPPEALDQLALVASLVVVAWDAVGQAADHTRRQGREVAAQMRATLDQLDEARRPSGASGVAFGRAMAAERGANES